MVGKHGQCRKGQRGIMQDMDKIAEEAWSVNNMSWRAEKSLGDGSIGMPAGTVRVTL